MDLLSDTTSTIPKTVCDKDKDVFWFNIDFNNGVVRPNSYNFRQADIDHDCKTYGTSCAAKIMRDGWKINY